MIGYRSEDCPPPRKQTKLFLLREDAFTRDEQVTFGQDTLDMLEWEQAHILHTLAMNAYHKEP